MGVHWTAISYKKDYSYITGEVKARGLYEFDIEKASPFSTNHKVMFRNGASLFYTIIQDSGSFENYGLYEKERQLSFYFCADDMIDGTTIRRHNGARFGLLSEPAKPLETLLTIANNTYGFDTVEIESKIEMKQLIKLLEEAVQNNYSVHFFWI